MRKRNIPRNRPKGIHAPRVLPVRAVRQEPDERAIAHANARQSVQAVPRGEDPGNGRSSPRRAHSAQYDGPSVRDAHEERQSGRCDSRVGRVSAHALYGFPSDAGGSVARYLLGGDARASDEKAVCGDGAHARDGRADQRSARGSESVQSSRQFDRTGNLRARGCEKGAVVVAGGRCEQDGG